MRVGTLDRKDGEGGIAAETQRLDFEQWGINVNAEAEYSKAIVGIEKLQGGKQRVYLNGLVAPASGTLFGGSQGPGSYGRCTRPQIRKMYTGSVVGQSMLELHWSKAVEKEGDIIFSRISVQAEWRTRATGRGQHQTIPYQTRPDQTRTSGFRRLRDVRIARVPRCVSSSNSTRHGGHCGTVSCVDSPPHYGTGT